LAAMAPVFSKLRTLGIPPVGGTSKDGQRAQQLPEELKTRVISRAAEIRARWEEDPIGTEIEEAPRGRWRRRRGESSVQDHDPSDTARAKGASPTVDHTDGSIGRAESQTPADRSAFAPERFARPTAGIP